MSKKWPVGTWLAEVSTRDSEVSCIVKVVEPNNHGQDGVFVAVFHGSLVGSLETRVHSAVDSIHEGNHAWRWEPLTVAEAAAFRLAGVLPERFTERA